MGNTFSRTIAGIGMLILGVALLVVSFFESYWLLIYAIPLIIIGPWTLFNDKEDKIEKIKSYGGKK